MTDQLPEEIILNGVNASEKSANRGKPLLRLPPETLKEIAKQSVEGQNYEGEHLKQARKRVQQSKAQKEGTLAMLEFSRDPNSLAQAGWGVIFPNRTDNRRIEAIREALGELLDWRKEQAGDLYKVCIGEGGYQPGDTAYTFMQRYGASPGVVKPKPLPFYLLIVGDVDEIPYQFQYELALTYLVGRIHFNTLEEYAWYAHSVVTAEQTGLSLARRAVFFGTAHQGDRATELSSTMLIEPLVNQLRGKMTGWQIDHLPPAECKTTRLEELLGNGDAPTLLFTASHGVGFDLGDSKQLPFQGALLCQDLEKIDSTISRKHYVGAEDIKDDFKLHGLVNFHFACFGSGTPKYDNFTLPGIMASLAIAPRDFLAALPRRLLGHPNGGALAVIGHVDRAWTYSFKWGEAVEQTQTFQDTLERLMSGQRVGLALDPFNMRYAQINGWMYSIYKQGGKERPNIPKWIGMWTANNDARSYMLLGDPAILLPVAKGEEEPLERQALAPIEVHLPAIVTDADTTFEPTSPAGTNAPDVLSGKTIITDTTGDPELRSQLQQNLRALAAQMDTFADDLGSPAAESPFAIEAEGFTVRQTWDEWEQKLRETMQTISERLKDFASDMVTLEVRTYTSEQIEEEDYRDGAFTGGARQRALTTVSLDGDTQIVIPVNAGELDEVVWEIHARAVEQAQANRTAILKAIGEMLAGLIPTGK